MLDEQTAVRLMSEQSEESDLGKKGMVEKD